LDGRYSKLIRQDIDTLATLAAKAKLHPDVRAHIHNIVVFMRMHRAVASGVTPHATRHLYALIHALAPLHGLDFITPSLVALAVRKIYPHRLVIVDPEDEMSLQWGSEVEAVREYLDGMTGEDVIEDVLERVETPL
jgi:MoxR-like ATPase